MSTQTIQPQPLTAVSVKQILFASDFSPACAVALPYVRAIARLYGASVYVAHVIPPEPRSSVPMDVMSEELVETRRHAEMQMKQFLTGDPLNGIQHGTVIERGDPRTVIEAAVKSYKIDMVAVGTHGRGGMHQLMAGSVAETIFRHVDCPVLTVGPGVHSRGLREAKFEQILFATDFSEGSAHALPYALSLAMQTGAKLTLVHACSDVGTTPYLLELALTDAQKKLAAMVPEGTELAQQPECVVRVGSAVDAIIKVAETTHADLAVMGAHRAKWAASTHLPWAIAHQVAHSAPCPVLTVRS